MSNLAPLFAQVRSDIAECCLACDDGCQRDKTVAALSVIERHVQDMARETRCEKCGTDDVLVRWHEKRPRDRQAACRDSMSVLDFGKRPELKSEHLHYHCRRCQFDWTGPVLAALPAREKEEE